MSNNIEKKLPGARKDVSLKNYTTFRAGGKADWFLEVKNKKDLIKSILVAREEKIPFLVLGGGSNTLISDDGFRGLVVRFVGGNISSSEGGKVKIDAGSLLGSLVSFCSKNKLGGMEWAIGIPGTVGGSIVGNAGAFGGTISDHLVSVDVFDLSLGDISMIEKKDCNFGYRSSLFEKNKELIVLGVEMIFFEKKQEEIQRNLEFFLSSRLRKQPKGFSVGSVFKNYYFGSKGEEENFVKNFPEAKDKISDGKLSAGYLIDACNLRGFRVGGAMISDDHSNFIINFDNAKTKDFVSLSDLAREKVRNRFGIVLEREFNIF